MPIIRTPNDRFENLPDYPFSPHFVEINKLRMHYLDEGEGDPILCLHGEPTWSYLYRKMIPMLTPHGRVLAPDFIGFGKSDKFTEQHEYSFQMHHETMMAFVQQLDLQNITIVVQDWGGMIGLRLVSEMPDRFARLVIMNTMLPTGQRRPSPIFTFWRLSAKYLPKLPVGLIMQLATASKLPKEVIAAYQAPFPARKYMAGAKVFPELVPISKNKPGTEAMIHARAVLSQWQKPALVMFAPGDPILGSLGNFFRKLIPTANDQPLISIDNASHFLQEDKGEEIAEHIVHFLERTKRLA